MVITVPDEIFELRILSGLHKGARQELVGNSIVVIGSDDSCDIILRDQDVPARAIQFHQQDGTWVLQWLTDVGTIEAEKTTVLAAGKAVLLATESVGSRVDAPVVAIQPVQIPWPRVVPPLLTRRGLAKASFLNTGSNAFRSAPSNNNAALIDSRRHIAGEAEAGGHVDVDVSVDAFNLKASSLESLALAEGQIQGNSPAKKLSYLPSRAVVAAILGMALTLIVFLSYGWFTHLAGPQTRQDKLLSSNSASTLDAASVEKSRAAITAIAIDLKLGPRVRIESLDGGATGLLVKAGPLADDETEALATALSRLSPRPGLRVVSEFELREQVRDAVARQNAARNGVLSISSVGLGRFQIKGRLPENVDREEVLAALDAEFGAMAIFDSALVTSPEVAAQMVGELQKTGLASVQGQWQAGKLQLQVQIPKANVPQWETALAQISARLPLPFAANLSWTANLPKIAASARQDGFASMNGGGDVAPRSNNNLPFKLQSIVSGTTPYVVTADGGKLMPGGILQGWTLININSKRVLFESVQGARTVEVQR